MTRRWDIIFPSSIAVVEISYLRLFSSTALNSWPTISIYLITVVIWFLSGLFFQEIESKYCYQLLWKCFFLVHTRLKPEISNNNRLNWIKATIYRSCNFLYKIVYRKCYFHGPLQFYICTYTNTQKFRPMYHTYLHMGEEPSQSSGSICVTVKMEYSQIDYFIEAAACDKATCKYFFYYR